MKSTNDSLCSGDPSSERRFLHDDACHFHKEEMGLSTPLFELPALDGMVNTIGLIDSRTTNGLRRSYVIHDLRGAIVADMMVME